MCFVGYIIAVQPQTYSSPVCYLNAKLKLLQKNQDRSSVIAFEVR